LQWGGGVLGCEEVRGAGHAMMLEDLTAPKHFVQLTKNCVCSVILILKLF